MTHISVMNPLGSPPPPEAFGAALATLAGATVGFFSNNKPGASVLLEAIAGALRERFAIEPKFFTKPVPSLEAEPELLRACSESCRAVVLAAYD